MHVLMENRHGIGVDIRVGKADGYAERKCCLRMLDRVKRSLGIEPATLGADKGYDTEDFALPRRNAASSRTPRARAGRNSMFRASRLTGRGHGGSISVASARRRSN
jgi:hypothetical protein